jgi:hypothetical protein
MRFGPVSQLTCEQHEDGGAGDVGRRATPAAGHAGPERDEHDEEGHDEQGDSGTTHVCKIHTSEYIYIHMQIKHFSAHI